jgi:hypothetical protein
MNKYGREIITLINDSYKSKFSFQLFKTLATNSNITVFVNINNFLVLSFFETNIAYKCNSLIANNFLQLVSF